MPRGKKSRANRNLFWIPDVYEIMNLLFITHFEMTKYSVQKNKLSCISDMFMFAHKFSGENSMFCDLG
jgi:hypothetical protein